MGDISVSSLATCRSFCENNSQFANLRKKGGGEGPEGGEIIIYFKHA